MSQNEHDALLKAAIVEMQRQGFTNICADHLHNFSQPALVGGYIPDATGYYKGSPVIVEVESETGLSQQHTEDQWWAFINAAKRNNGFFIAVVSRRQELTARLLLNKINTIGNDALLWSL